MRKLALVGIFGLAVLASGAEAGTITSISFGGSGGAGAAPGFTPGTSDTAAITKDFATIDPITFTFTVDAGGLYRFDELVANVSGIDWFSFRFAGSGGTSVNLAGIPAPFTSGGADPGGVTISGGTVLSGGTFNPAVLVVVDRAGTYTVVETPNSAVPEPATLAMLACALPAGLIAWRRRKS